jgi:hypothetical protein
MLNTSPSFLFLNGNICIPVTAFLNTRTCIPTCTTFEGQLRTENIVLIRAQFWRGGFGASEKCLISDKLYMCIAVQTAHSTENIFSIGYEFWTRILDANFGEADCE